MSKQKVSKDNSHRYERVSERITKIRATVRKYKGLKLIGEKGNKINRIKNEKDLFVNIKNLYKDLNVKLQDLKYNFRKIWGCFGKIAATKT
jgi:hypothetical protein